MKKVFFRIGALYLCFTGVFYAIAQVDQSDVGALVIETESGYDTRAGKNNPKNATIDSAIKVEDQEFLKVTAQDSIDTKGYTVEFKSGSAGVFSVPAENQGTEIIRLKSGFRAKSGSSVLITTQDYDIEGSGTETAEDIQKKQEALGPPINASGTVVSDGKSAYILDADSGEYKRLISNGGSSYTAETIGQAEDSKGSDYTFRESITETYGGDGKLYH